VETFGVVVIGGGPGGYPAAIRAAQLGATVALVEKEELGGACLNWGCIPTKTLLASSALYARMKSAGEMGLQVQGAAFDYGAMTDRKDQVVRTLRNGIKQLLKANGIKIFQGTASFKGRNRLLIDSRAATPDSGPASVVIGAEKTIIATGATSAMPDFLPRHERAVDSRLFLERKSLPSSAVVLGGGAIGCEFACLLAQLGVRVTVVELLEDILWSLDADVRRELRRQMEKTLGMRILTGVTLEEITADDRCIRGRAGSDWVEAELLLAALGRKPVTEELKLENAGLTTNAQGFIEVDEYGRTQVATIHAIGDVTGGPKLAHAATSQGLVAAENACGRRLRKNEPYVPNCIFTSPEIGTVGLSEQEAHRQGKEIKTGKFMLGALGKALAMGEPMGFVKWIADAETDQLLGAHAIGPHATELIAEATTALRAELTAAELGRTIHAHPTLAEAWMEAAHVLLGEPIHAVPRRRK
jgi:dihydrolipoamide dehydrogenase